MVDTGYGTDALQVHTNEMTAGVITNTVIATDAIGAAEIAANAITNAELATDCIGTDEIATDAIDADGIAASAIGAAEIATDAIGAAEIAADAITTAELATGCISADEVADDAIDAGAIADSAIDAATYAANAITDAAVANDVQVDVLTIETAGALAGINADVLDVMNVDTFAEMAGGAPPAAPTLAEILNYMYRLNFHERHITATTDDIRNAADSADLFDTVLSDDGTTFIRQKYDAP